MTQTLYTLTYPDDIPDVSFSTEAAMRRYLEGEAEIWKAFLSRFGAEEKWAALPTERHGKVSAAQLASSLDRLISAVGDHANFQRMQQQYSGHCIALPPPAETMEGQLILGLANNGRTQAAHCVFLWFAARQKVIAARSNQQGHAEIEYGVKLITAAYAAEALPFRQVTSQRLAGAVRKAENHAASLQEEVAAAQAINATHEEELSDYRDDLTTRTQRIEKIFFGRERRRRTRANAGMAEFEKFQNKSFGLIRGVVRDTTNQNKKQQERMQGEFEKLKKRFYEHMRLRAPAKLWEDRSEEHAKNAKWALWGFGIGVIAAILAGLLVPLYLGDQIAASFATELCNKADPSDCKRVFSAKGPLMVAGLLTVMSLILWGIRLQYRVFLSERHLSLDASQKRAFAETYLAMREDASVGAENEAIVLASLFRSTQDGIIKDDDGSLDLSAAAILAKQLGKGA